MSHQYWWLYVDLWTYANKCKQLLSAVLSRYPQEITETLLNLEY